MNTISKFFHYFVLAGALLVSFFFSTGSQAQETRLPVTIANNTTSTLTDYVFRLDLNATNAPGFDFANNGDDIVIWNSDTTAQLDFYVESVDDVTDTAVVWVRAPSVPVSPPDTQIFVDYNVTGASASPLSNAGNTFTQSGFKFHTQPYTDADPGPESRVAGEAIFDFDTVSPPSTNTGCTQLAGLGTNNNGQFGMNMDFAIFIETFFEVTTPALYEFRFGGDFGHGGELYLDGVTLEEGWTEDLWWSVDFNNADVLQGSRFLDAGTHTLRALGFERCCDGQVQLQYRIDTDGDGDLSDETFAALEENSVGITPLAPSCPTGNAMIAASTTVPVTLSKFRSFKAGPFIKFEWETADETFNAGFDLWTLSKDDEGTENLRQLNRRLIRSRHFDSLDTQRYRHRLTVSDPIENVVISSSDINGKQEFFGPFAIGETYGADYQPQPIDWRKVHADFRKTMLSKGFTRTNQRWRRVKAPSSDNQVRVQLTTDRDGMHRVSYEDLAAIGVDWRGVTPQQIALTHDDVAIPRRIKRSGDPSARGRFGPGSYIDFVGVRPRGEAGLYAKATRFQLSLDRSKALRVRTNKRASQLPQTWAYKTVRLDSNNRHSIVSPIATPWFIDIIYRTTQIAKRDFEINIDAAEVIHDQPSSLSLVLAGVTDLPAADFDGDGVTDPDHVLSIRLNNTLLETIRFDGQFGKNVTLEVPSELLRPGSNIVTLSVLDSGYFFDAIGVDAIELSYPIKSDVRAQGLQFNSGDSDYDGLIFSSKNRKGLVAYQYRLDHNLMPLKIRKNSARGAGVTYSVPFGAQGNSDIFIGHDLMTPSALELLPPQGDLVLRNSDLFIISHPAFIGPELEQYVQQRRQQGVESQVFSTDQIHRAFGADVSVHEAIKRFLKDADQKVEYHSVLLVGGHSFDYNNYLSDQTISFIPAFYRAIGVARYTPTDQPFVDFDNDGYPEKKIGRWPVRTPENVATIAAKSILWAENQDTRRIDGHRVVMLSDTSRDLPFQDDIEAQLEGLLNTDIKIGRVEKVYLDEIASDDSVVTGDLNAVAQERSAQALSESTWAFYSGHGSPVNWSSSGLVTSASVRSLANINAPILITSIGCYTTYYESPSHNSLAHQLLFANDLENNGAVAIHGPALVGGYEHQKILANLIVEKSAQGKSIGDAVKDGMLALPVNYSNAILNWALLADPTLTIQ